MAVGFHIKQEIGLQEVATIAGMFLADKVGRRQMLIQTTVQSLIAQAVLAGILACFTDSNTIQMGPVPSKAAIILVSLGHPTAPVAFLGS